MTKDVNEQDKKHRPEPKPDSNKKPVASITNNIVGIGPPPRHENREKNRQK